MSAAQQDSSSCLQERANPGLHSYVASLLTPYITQTASILDVGCGTGAWLSRIRPLTSGRVVGLDYEKPDAIPGLDLRQFDINTGLLDSVGIFDVITCIEVIEHIENIGRLLDLWHASLAPSGVAVITTPNIESLRARTRALVAGSIPSFDSKGDRTHLMPILRDSLSKMLARRGMEISLTKQFPPQRNSSVQFQRPVRFAAKLLAFLPDELYGDTVIHFVRHKGVPTCA